MLSMNNTTSLHQPSYDESCTLRQCVDDVDKLEKENIFVITPRLAIHATGCRQYNVLSASLNKTFLSLAQNISIWVD